MFEKEVGMRGEYLTYVVIIQHVFAINHRLIRLLDVGKFGFSLGGQRQQEFDYD